MGGGEAGKQGGHRLSAPEDRFASIVDRVREARGIDPRRSVLEAWLRGGDDAPRIMGWATDPEDAAALVAEARKALGPAAADEIIRLPDPELGTARSALVRAAVAPLYRESDVDSTMLSQYVVGHRLELLRHEPPFWLLRGEDGHVGWMHQGYLVVGGAEWAHAWERGEGGEPLVALGAQLADDADRTFARLPWGGRVMQQAGERILLPDGRRGRLRSGELLHADRLADRFPARGESVTRTAREWVGVPYLWGGVTRAGADCSGFVQAVCWMHGIALPRDSDLQAGVGETIDVDDDFEALRPGDLAFFAMEGARIEHVAISLGGRHAIHSALTNGGVEVNDLLGDLELEERLRRGFRTARRLLPA